jgi:hypothetical protein
MRSIQLELLIQQLPDLMIQMYVTIIAIATIVLAMGLLRQLFTTTTTVKKRG